MMRFLLLLLMGLTLALPQTATAQSEDDQAAVQKTVETYFDGYTRGDTTTLATVFHPDFELKWLSRNQYRNVDREGMFAFFGPDWNHEITSEILSIDITGTAAMAKVDVTLVGMVKWIDYISLLKIGGKWWIVHKLSHGMRP